MEKPRPRVQSDNPLKRYIADPGAMGLFAFATITFMSGCIHCGWMTEVDKALYSPAVFYGGLVQVIAGILDLLRGEKVSGSTFTAFGFYWVSIGYWLWPGLTPENSYTPQSDFMRAKGWYLMGWAFIAFASFLAVLNTSILQIILLGLVTLDFSCLCAINLSGNMTLNKVTGYFLVVTAALAYYIGVAFLLKGKSPIQLPIWQLSSNDDEDQGSYKLDRELVNTSSRDDAPV